MVTVPAATPVTTPILLTVAIPVFDDSQGVLPDAVTDPDKVVVDPAHTLNVPMIVGNGLIKTEEEVNAEVQPVDVTFTDKEPL